MKDKIKEIKFIEYNGIEGYIELMKHDVEPLNNPECKNICLCYDGKDIKALLDYITNLQQENERLKEQNNDLRKIYRNTYKRLFKNGNDELARYFQAQIDDCPTFYVEPIIDYAKEYEIYKSRCEKAIEYIKSYNLPEDLGYFGEAPISISELRHLLNILNGSDEK